MPSVYKYLCYAIAALVVLQAGFIAWAFFGMSDWVTDDNGVVNTGTDSTSPMPWTVSRA